MKNFFVVQSQDPFTDARTAQQFELVRTLASRGNKVKVMLVQNAVLAARLDARAGPLFQLLDNRISLYADEFSLAHQRDQTQRAADICRSGRIGSGHQRDAGWRQGHLELRRSEHENINLRIYGSAF